MKRITYALAVVASAALPGFGQFVHVGPGDVEIVNTNYTGLPGVTYGAGAFVQQATTLKVSSSQIYGAGPGDTDYVANGGFGMLVVQTPDFRLDNGATIYGGAGGDVTSDPFPISTDVNVYGGLGAAVSGGDLTQFMVVSNAAVYGGAGGTVQNAIDATENVFAYGGIGIVDQNATLVLEDGAQVFGGRGGGITTSAALSADQSSVRGGVGVQFRMSANFEPTGDFSVYGGDGGTFSSTVDGLVTDASGGSALEFFEVATPMTINNGNYIGGAGGSVSGAEGSVAEGGVAAMFIDSTAAITLAGGTYTGGTGGTVNGVKEADGAALEISGSAVNVSGGTYVGDMVFSGSGASTVDISGGDLSGDILFLGSGSATLSLQDSWTNPSSNFLQEDGTATFTKWNDQHFKNITINDGTMNFNNQDFNMVAGSSLSLVEKTAIASFGQNATLDGAIDVGSGSITAASALTVKAGSTLSTTIYAGDGGVEGGMISAERATFEDDVSWTLVNDGSISNSDSLADGVLLASANVENGITHSFDGLEFSMIGNPSVLLGINGVTNTYNASSSKQELYATYGQLSLEKVFEDYPEMGPAMADLQMVLDSDPALAAYIASEWSDFDSLNEDFSQAFIRTPEVTSVLMGLQGVFAEQIKDRTRSNLRYKKFGSRASYSPSGAQGPGWSGNSASPSGARGPDWYENSVQWTQDHAPSWDAQGAVRAASDNAPVLDTGAAADSMNSVMPNSSGEGIELPETYQVWGRAYGSSLDQDATTMGHMGYDATIVGGVIGVDKRFEEMLIGLGVGYAHTDLDGRGGNDGDADTAYAMGYFSHSRDSLYFDATLSYAFNDVETEGASSVGYEGEYDASTFGFGIGTGYGMSFYKDQLLFTPEASYLGTYYNRGSYTEKSNLATPFPNKDYESYDQWSHLTSVGATLSTIGVLDYFNAAIEYQPELRAHWLHEFNAEMDDDSYVMVGGAGDPLAVALQAREEDLLRLGAGIRFSKWESDATEFGLDIDGAFGSDYHNFIVSGKIMHRF